MKLIRFGALGEEKPGVLLENGKRLDISGLVSEYDEGFFQNTDLEKLARTIENKNFPEVDDTIRWGPPLAKPSKIICIGLNYVAHAEESGMQIPKEPVIFFKSTTSISGPNDNVIIPKNGTKTDWEVELAVVIGKKASYVPEELAMEYIAGYMLHNDYSERAFQLEREGQWVKGKSCDTFAPLGPFLATKDEIKDPHDLNLWLDVNGGRKQTGNTGDFIFNIPQVVSYLSQFMTLLPGDIISTGTPPGVGLGFDPPQYLKPGDQVTYGIDRLGIGKQTIEAYN